jgi:hypothetical protein
MRAFESGAIRDTDKGKIKYADAICLEFFQMYGSYMREHCTQKDGQFRETGNWKKGFGLEVTIDSFFRHAVDFVLSHYGIPVDSKLSHEDLGCAVMFNLNAYMQEYLDKEKEKANDKPA